MQWIYPIYSLLLVLSIAIISEEAAVTVPETARLPVRATRVRKLVLEHQDRALKVDRCHYTDDLPKRGFTNSNSLSNRWNQCYQHLKVFEDGAVVTVESLILNQVS